MRLIGLMGQAGSGKATVAGFLRERGYASIAFADPLKVFIRDTWGLPDAVLWGPSELRSLPIRRCGCGCVGVTEWAVSGGEAEPCCHDPDRSQIEVWTCGGDGCGWVGQDPGNTSPCCGAAIGREPLTARLALQRLGTEWGRALDPEVWIRMGIRRARALEGAECNRHHRGSWRGLPTGRLSLPSAGVPVATHPCAAQCDRIGGPVTPATGEDCPECGRPWPTRLAGVVITDCRFANEAQAVRDAGGVVWRVERETRLPWSCDQCGAPGWKAVGPEGWCDEHAPASWRSHASETEQVDVEADVTIINAGTLGDLRALVTSKALED